MRNIEKILFSEMRKICETNVVEMCKSRMWATTLLWVYSYVESKDCEKIYRSNGHISQATLLIRMNNQVEAAKHGHLAGGHVGVRNVLHRDNLLTRVAAYDTQMPYEAPTCSSSFCMHLSLSDIPDMGMQ